MKQQGYQKFECENCGAPLTRMERRGEYRCSFCGAIYINEDHFEDEPVKQPQPAVYSEPDMSSSPDYSLPSFSSITADTKSKKKGGKLAGFLILLSVICGLIAFCRNPNTSDNNSSVNETVIQQSTPVMVTSLPSSPISVGDPIAYQGWEMKVNRGLSAANGEINFSITLTNWSGSDAVFHFKPDDIQLKDNAGNEYSIGEGYCDRDQLFFVKEVPFEDQQSRQMETGSSWCRNQDELPSFSGAIVSHATKLYVIFDDFGPFSELIYEFDL